MGSARGVRFGTQWPVLLFLTIGAGRLPQVWSQCIPIHQGETVRATLSKVSAQVCFAVTLQPNQATQVITEQPEDLEFHLTMGGVATIIDGFQFGSETLTLRSPGNYRVELRRVAPPSASVLHFSVSRREITMEQATAWEKAETAATAARHSRELANIELALRLWKELGEMASVARTYLRQGDVNLASSRFLPSRESYETALTICATIPDTRCTAEAANNSGWASVQLGQFGPALEQLQRAAQDWKKIADQPNEGRTLSNLGLLFRRTGDFQNAISLYDRARRLLRSKDPLGDARVLNNLGLCYTSLTEYDRARLYLESALAIYARNESHIDSARTRLNLGRTLSLTGQFRQARIVLEQALQEASVAGDRNGRADVLNNLGQLAWRRGAMDEASARLGEALALEQEIGDLRGEASALHYLALIQRTQGDLDKARVNLLQAAKIRSDLGLREDAADSMFVLADMQSDAGELAAARDLAERALTLLESVRGQVPGPALRAAFYSNKRRFFDLLVELAMRSGGASAPADALLASERGRARALLDLMAEGWAGKQLSPDAQERRRDLQRRIGLLSARLSLGSRAQQEELRGQVERLVGEEAEAEAKFRAEISSRQVTPLLASVEELQRRGLPADSALIEYHLGEKRSYLWLVSNQTIQVFSLPPRSVVENQIAPVLALFLDIQGRQRSAAREAAFRVGMRRVSALLLDSVSGASLPQRLILVPDGILHRVPFAALWLGSNLRLGLAHDLVQAPAAGYLLAGRSPRPVQEFRKTILALADPVFSPDDIRVKEPAAPSNRAGQQPELARLFFTAELTKVETLVPQSRREILRDFEVNAGTLNELPLQDFAVLHFSTHAMIDDRTPEASRIALSLVDPAGRPVDGFLHPYHLAQFHLDGSIVVLSACNTALGKQVQGEGLAGFSSSLFSAGAAQLVLSLTKADAEASSQFFSYTYQRYFAGRSIGIEQAMTLSRREMSRSKRWADPYYWGSFVVIGRPTIFH
jgi:CHAT domain-containing protein/Tfp pilus assembly protein PilF